LLNKSTLDYLVEIVDAELFGGKMYADIFDKTAIYLYNIISNHVFTDRNKRTGLDSCILFLDINGYQISSSVTNIILKDFILSIGSGNGDFTISADIVERKRRKNNSIFLKSGTITKNVC